MTDLSNELLEALRGFVEYFEADFDQPKEYFDALRVIKKATGGTKVGEPRQCRCGVLIDFGDQCGDCKVSEQGFEVAMDKTYIAEDMSRTMSQTEAILLVYFLADLTEDKSKDERLAMSIVKHMIENSDEDQ